MTTRSSEFWRGGSSGRDTGNAGKIGFIVETSFLKWVLWVFRIYFCGLIDEIHVLGDSSRGATLEAIVSRLKAIGQSLGEETALHRCRFVAVSATAPNMKEVGEWLSGGSNAVTTTWEFGEEYRGAFGNGMSGLRVQQ